VQKTFTGTVRPMVTSYDQTPYSNLPFAQTRPAVLASVARLHGLRSPDPRTARVLELACGAGANLLGIAAAEPGVRALGVDLAATAVARARDDARAAGLANVAFEVADVRDLVDGRLGIFDYVIVHGLYAWVGDDVRDATLTACRAHLAEDGLAFVSYAAHPGGHLRRMLREAGAWHARAEQDPVARAARARELFSLLDGLASPDFAGAVGEELNTLAAAPTEMLVHDLLGEQHEAVWLADFVAAAERHDLAYVADALPEGSRRPRLPAAVAEFIDAAAGPDAVAREQYLDLIVLRRFRQSLLCRAGRRPTAGVDVLAVTDVLVAYEGPSPVDAPPMLRAALEHLAARPGPQPFASLRESLGVAPGPLAEALMQGFDVGCVSFHVVPLPASPVAGPRPRASALARSQAAPGADVTTLLSQIVRFTDEPTSELVRLLDGTRDRAAILRDFTAGPLSEDALEAALAQLARLGLLHA